MRTLTTTEQGNAKKPNEDWYAVRDNLAVVLDGATARTDTGCVHGVAWYAANLGNSLLIHASSHARDLRTALANSIRDVVALHPECDLSHPGTPSAAVGIVRFSPTKVEFLVLGDVTVLMDTSSGLRVVTDDRVSATAQPDRDIAMSYPIGSPERASALVRMKKGELAARNHPGGYWIAANDPHVVSNSLTGDYPAGQVHRVALLTDGAARAAFLFGLLDWSTALEILANEGPETLIRTVRKAETTDPTATRWPRTKLSDDATIVYAEPAEQHSWSD